MKRYNKVERMMNTISRAMKDFCYEVDETDTLQEIFDGAFNCITENVEYDRIEECELSDHHSCMFWSDGMGFEVTVSGDIIGHSVKDNRWIRKNEDGTYSEIEWFEADAEKDYVVCEHEIDSEGNLVMLIGK